MDAITLGIVSLFERAMAGGSRGAYHDHYLFGPGNLQKRAQVRLGHTDRILKKCCIVVAHGLPFRLWEAICHRTGDGQGCFGWNFGSAQV
jgi:hypothetical protein